MGHYVPIVIGARNCNDRGIEGVLVGTVVVSGGGRSSNDEPKHQFSKHKSYKKKIQQLYKLSLVFRQKRKKYSKQTGHSKIVKCFTASALWALTLFPLQGKEKNRGWIEQAVDFNPRKFKFALMS